MERLKKEKVKKVRVLITIDEELYIKYGLYIDNLSAYLNSCIRNKIDAEEAKLYNNDTDNTRLCLKVPRVPKIKSSTFTDDELLEIAKYRWIDK